MMRTAPPRSPLLAAAFGALLLACTAAAGSSSPGKQQQQQPSPSPAPTKRPDSRSAPTPSAGDRPNKSPPPLAAAKLGAPTADAAKNSALAKAAADPAHAGDLAAAKAAYIFAFPMLQAYSRLFAFGGDAGVGPPEPPLDDYAGLSLLRGPLTTVVSNREWPGLSAPRAPARH